MQTDEETQTDAEKAAGPPKKRRLPWRAGFSFAGGGAFFGGPHL